MDLLLRCSRRGSEHHASSAVRPFLQIVRDCGCRRYSSCRLDGDRHEMRRGIQARFRQLFSVPSGLVCTKCRGQHLFSMHSWSIPSSLRATSMLKLRRRTLLHQRKRSCILQLCSVYCRQFIRFELNKLHDLWSRQLLDCCSELMCRLLCGQLPSSRWSRDLHGMRRRNVSPNRRVFVQRLHIMRRRHILRVPWLLELHFVHAWAVFCRLNESVHELRVGNVPGYCGPAKLRELQRRSLLGHERGCCGYLVRELQPRFIFSNFRLDKLQRMRPRPVFGINRRRVLTLRRWILSSIGWPTSL